MPVVEESSSVRTLVDQLLDEQRRLTAVERFSRIHDSTSVPAQARYYRDLIPSAVPGADEQYAFTVDLDTCTGCKACVSACHSLNGLEEGETWRKVGVLHGFNSSGAMQQTITTACHHCVDPGCLNGCPVDAYEKDNVTGIVRHLDDQCIGCQYCVLKCPYDVPQYSKRLGIVRKCDMCSSRLTAGEAPACVQACPNEAIRIEIVQKSDIEAASAPGTHLVEGCADSSYTKPSTRYVTRKPRGGQMLPADAFSLKPEHSHPPLVIMLVLTQLSVGAYLFQLTAESSVAAIIALVAGLSGIGASTMHLGRPFYAWRAFIGLRHSWLSREIVGFGAFAGAALLYTAAVALGYRAFTLPLSIGVALTGVACVVCSAMIYHDTRRDFWRGMGSFGKFFGTALVLGAATMRVNFPSNPWFAGILGLVTVSKLAWECRFFRVLDSDPTVLTPPVQSAMLMLSRELSVLTRARFLFTALGGIVLPLEILAANGSLATAILALVFCFVGELLERWLFFTAVVAPGMPGGFRE